jgi:O-antigen ligase
VWRFYAQVLYSLNLEFDPAAATPFSRDGVVRPGGGPMFQTLAFAYYISMAMVTCFFFWKKGILRFIPAAILMLLYSCALMFTDSKGGILAVMVGVLVVYYVDLHKSFKFLAAVAGVIIASVASSYLFTSDLSKADDSDGSFSYRYQLFLNSFDAISENPIFGSSNFAANQLLQGSIQGEGIVDVVNLYLLVALKYGFVGLFLYLMIFLSLIKGAVKKSNVAGFDHKGLVLALISMTMVLIITISDASFVPFYIMFVWAVSRAYVSLQEAPLGMGLSSYRR